jgi:hypothetical protein
MKHGEDREPRNSPGSRRPGYVFVIAASDWVTDRFPAAGVNLQDALRAGHDRRRDPEPDLEAEP